MLVRRRLTFQLTPLLDLLLIVIFAQYLEVQQTAESAEQAAAAARQDVDRAREDLQDQKRELQQEFAARSRQLEASQAEAVAAAERLRQQYADRFHDIVVQQEQVAATLAETFRLPGELIEQVAKLRLQGANDDADRLQEASARLADMLDARGQEFLRFIIRFDEMQKHVTVWELHLQDNGQAAFGDGQQIRTVSFENRSEFVRRLFDISKSLTEPKPLVIILVTYGDAQARLRLSALEAMPDLVAALRHDADRTRWFDYSVLGYRAAGPLFGVPPSASADRKDSP